MVGMFSRRPTCVSETVLPTRACGRRRRAKRGELPVVGCELAELAHDAGLRGGQDDGLMAVLADQVDQHVLPAPGPDDVDAGCQTAAC